MAFTDTFDTRDLRFEFYENALTIGAKYYYVHYQCGPKTVIHRLDALTDGILEVPAGGNSELRCFKDTLFFAENLEASGGVYATRNVTVTVYTELANGWTTTDEAHLLFGQVFNPPPAPPEFTLSSNVNQAFGEITVNPLAADVAGYWVAVGASENFDPATAPIRQRVSGNLFRFGINDNTQHWVRAAAYDSFGEDGMIWSSAKSVTRTEIANIIDTTPYELLVTEALADLDLKGAAWLATAQSQNLQAVAGIGQQITAVATDAAAETDVLRQQVVSNEAGAALYRTNTNTRVTAAETKITATETLVAQHGNKIGVIDGKLVVLSNDIETVSQSLTTIVAQELVGIQSSITEEATARATGDSTNAQAITNLTSAYNTNKAAVDQKFTTQATTNSTVAGQLTQLTTNYGNADTRISNEVTARTNADTALGQRVDTLTTTVSGNLATLTQADTANTNATSAVANRATTLEAKMNGTTSSPLLAKINDEITARADADSAQANRSNTIEARLNNGGDIRAAITTAQNVAVDAQGKANATWGLTSNVNGLISGISSVNNGSISRLDLQASRIRFLNDSGAGALSPFTVEGGVVKMQKVSLSGADVSLNVNNRFIVNAAGDCSWYSPTGVLLMKAGTL